MAFETIYRCIECGHEYDYEWEPDACTVCGGCDDCCTCNDEKEK